MKNETKSVLRLHVGLALAEAICLGAFVLELTRALGGNTLSWAYVFEWPLFGVYAVYMWRRLVTEQRAGVRRTLKDSSGVEGSGGPTAPEAADPALEAYNEYLRRVHRPGPASRDRAGD